MSDRGSSDETRSLNINGAGKTRDGPEMIPNYSQLAPDVSHVF